MVGRVTQGSQSLALGLATTAAAQLVNYADLGFFSQELTKPLLHQTNQKRVDLYVQRFYKHFAPAER